MTDVWVSVVTHLTAFGVGWAVAHAIMVRYVRVREIEGHAALELCHDPDHGGPMPAPASEHHSLRQSLSVPLVVLVACLFIIGIGAQAYVAERDNAERDRESLERDKRDAAYAQCLTDFAEDLVATLEVRGAAIARLQRAQQRKDEALDRLLRVVELRQRTPPQATDADFHAALVDRVRAQDHFNEVAERITEVREANPFKSPKVECDR